MVHAILSALIKLLFSCVLVRSVMQCLNYVYMHVYNGRLWKTEQVSNCLSCSRRGDVSINTHLLYL